MQSYKTPRKIGDNLNDLGFGFKFLGTYITKSTISERKTMHLIKTKNFCSVKNTVKRVQRQARLGENTCKSHVW